MEMLPSNWGLSVNSRRGNSEWRYFPELYENSFVRYSAGSIPGDAERIFSFGMSSGMRDGQGAHFDPIMAELLAGLGSEYAEAYATDPARADALGNAVNVRADMYNPLYYLCSYYEGCGSANVAQYWRIRTGIEQGDTALTTEVDLALALEAYGAEVDFETVWGQGHTKAERTGSSDENFIAWVVECLGGAV